METYIFHSPSLSLSLDQLLDGGLLTGELTEVCGGPGQGKTQVAMAMVMTLPSRPM